MFSAKAVVAPPRDARNVQKPPRSVLTKQKILDAAEEVLLQQGPAKATVVDVARMLGVSHANVYKFFVSKAELRQAVVETWLDRMDAALAGIVRQRVSPQVRFKRWLDAFVGARQKAWRSNPQLFGAFRAVAAEQSPAVWKAYKARVTQSLALIIADGIADRTFKTNDALAAATAVVDGNVRFFHPAHCREWADPRVEAAYQTVRDLLLAGLRAGPGDVPNAGRARITKARNGLPSGADGSGPSNLAVAPHLPAENSGDVISSGRPMKKANSRQQTMIQKRTARHSL